MAFLSKKRKAAQSKVDGTKQYNLKEASALVKQATTCKFDASVDLHIRLGVDPKKADQAIRGTVSNDVAAAVNEVKGGKIAFKIDKAGIIHASIGRISFTPEKIAENSQELLNAIIKAKPSSAKGTYLRGISMASTMSPGITIDTKGFVH